MDKDKEVQAFRQNLEAALFLMKSNIRRLLGTKSAEHLKFSSLRNPNPPEGADPWAISEDALSDLRLMLENIEHMMRVKGCDPSAGFHEICSDKLHQQAFADANIRTIGTFFSADPLIVKFALDEAEKAGARKQYHLYASLSGRVQKHGERLAEEFGEYYPNKRTFLRESHRCPF